MEVTSFCDTYDIDSFNKTNFSSSSFRVMHCNIRSLRKNKPKLEIFLAALHNANFDVICVSETFLYPDETENFPLHDYTFVGSSRLSRAGGVGAYVRNGLVFGVEEAAVAGAEVLTLRIEGAAGGSHIYLTTIYRRPIQHDLDLFLSELDEYLLKTKYPQHIITGDMNINLLHNSSSSDHYLDLIHMHNFRSLISVPTRVTLETSTCIDHILTNFSHNVVYSGTIACDISDHFPVFSIFDTRGLKSNLYNKHQKIRNYRKLDVQQLLNQLTTIDWQTNVYNIEDPSIAYNNFVEEIMKVYDELIPLESVRPKQKSSFQCPWISPSILKAINKKNRLFTQHKKFPYSPKIKAQYLSQRNFVTKITRKAKADYFNNLINGESDPKKLWKVINSSCGQVSKPNFTPDKICNHEAETVTGHLNVANTLNSFFCEIGPKLAKNIPPTNESALHL